MSSWGLILNSVIGIWARNIKSYVVHMNYYHTEKELGRSLINLKCCSDLQWQLIAKRLKCLMGTKPLHK